jgi:hypothetical protein
LKLANVLAQYLYTNKRLDLPGIGTFFLDPSAIAQAENSKHRVAISDGIRFESNSSIQDAGDLINYISAKTGKMKSLAISDLESYLELAKQFLNIGKPFTFEGIGNLMKIKAGEFEFSPGSIATEKLKEIPQKETAGSSKNNDEKYESFLSSPSKISYRKPVITLLVLSGIGLAIWGGYIISSRNQENDNSVIESNAKQTIPVTDTSQINKPAPDSIKKTEATPDKYKYVLEIANAKRAFKRYNVLKDNMWDVKMETSDSVRYKLFLLLPVRSDTTKVLDSLTVLSGRKVYLENHN